MATDRELASSVRDAVTVLKDAVTKAQEAGITVKLGVVYGKAGLADGENVNVVKDITINLTKDL